jgi:DNA-binding IclR family transcriptional regulator
MKNLLSRTVEAFEVLSANPRGVTVTELAQQLDTSKSTSSRLLSALLEAGLVERDSTQRHFLDVRFWAWGVQSVKRLLVLDVARPHIAAAVKRHGVSVFVAVPREDQAVYLDCTTLRNGEVAYELVSYLVPNYACAPGKAMLAFSDPEVIERVVNGPLVQFTPHTLASKDALTAELDAIRQQGYALNRGEHVESGTLAIAAPVFDHSGQPIASICFFGFTDPELMQSRVEPLLELAETVSASLGFSRTMLELVG